MAASRGGSWHKAAARLRTALGVGARRNPLLDRSVEAADIRNAYRLFLDREPENEAVVDEKRHHSLATLLDEIVGSGEFAARVATLVKGQDDRPAPVERDLATWTRLLAAAPLPDPREGRGMLVLALLDAPALALHRSPALVEALQRARRLAEDAALLRASDLFDASWYHRTYPDTAEHDPALHFLRHGTGEGRLPSAFFDPALYLKANADVLASGQNALVHWLRHGRHEGRGAPAHHGRRGTGLRLHDICDPLRREHPQRTAQPGFRVSIVTPTYNTEPQYLRELFVTLLNQSFSDWEWVICDDGSTRIATINTLRAIAAEDDRVKLALAPLGRGISGATNDAIGRATGDYVALVDHDDLLARDVLERCWAALAAAGDTADIVYTDEAKVSVDGEIYDVFLKPAWSPVFLENTMYLGHLVLYRAAFLHTVGRFRSEVDGTQDYDIALRAALKAQRVVHVPTIGYLWRAVPGSTASSLDEKDYAVGRQRTALLDHARARSPQADVRPGFRPGYWRTDYPLASIAPLLSYVIPTAAGGRLVRGERLDLLTNCMESMIARGFATRCEFVIVHNGNLTERHREILAQAGQVTLVHYDEPQLNLARKMNLGVQAAKGEYVCLLNDDIEAITEGGGDILLGFLQAHPAVGAIAPLCLFESGTVQHNGVMLLEQGPAHAGFGHPPDMEGHFANLRCRREVFAVTGAMLFVRRDLYLEVGGFEETLPLNYNDVDFCLKLRRAGYSLVVDPEVRVFHYESASKVGTFKCEKETLFRRWPSLADPYFNQRFDQRDQTYVVDVAAPRARDLSDAVVFERWLDRRIAARTPAALPAGPLLSICIPVYNQPPAQLEEVLASCRMQTYANHELLFVDDASIDPATRAWLDRIAATGVARVVRHAENGGITAANRTWLAAARGEYVLPVDADDFLTIDALAVMAAAIAAHPDAKLFYSDEFKSNPQSAKFAPFFKPDFDPVMIANNCYVTHLMAFRTAFLRRIGAYDDDRATWCHDWSATLRALAEAAEPVHVPELLYAWRINPGSTASADADAKPEAVGSQEFVLDRVLAERGLADDLAAERNRLGPNTGMWALAAKRPVADVTVLDAATTWRLPEDRLRARLERAVDADGWVAILAATEEEERAAALLHLSAPALWDRRVQAVSGTLSDGDDTHLVFSGALFTRDGLVDPGAGLAWAEGGYHGQLYCQRCVDVLSPVNLLISRAAIRALLGEPDLALTGDAAMVRLGLLAERRGWLLAVTPHLRVPLPPELRMLLPCDRAGDVARSGARGRWYNAMLDRERPYTVDPSAG